MGKGRTNTRANRIAKRIAGYSAAAGAFLAGAAEADAGIVYSGPLSERFGVTYGPRTVTMEGSVPEMFFFGGGTYPIGGFLVYGKYDTFGVDAYFMGGNAGAPQQAFPFANALSASARVGTGYFLPYGLFYLQEYGQPYGGWTDSTPRYFGFTFERESDGSQLFGWGLVRKLGVRDGELLGWAYDDSGAPMHVGTVPEPTTLGLFALGAAGVALYRRRRKKDES
jgi:hypothetical protein